MLKHLCPSCGEIVNVPIPDYDSKWKKCPKCSAVLTDKTWNDLMIAEAPQRLTKIVERTRSHFPEIDQVDLYYAPNCVGGFLHKRKKNVILIGDIDILAENELEWLVARQLARILEVREEDLDDFVCLRGFCEGRTAHSKIVHEAYKRGFIFPSP